MPDRSSEMPCPRRIYVDVDEVLADTNPALREGAERLFGKRVPYEEMRTFDLRVSFGIDDAGEARLLDHLHQDHVLESLDPHDGVVGVLERWISLGCEVAVMTGRPPSTLAATRRWLERVRMPYGTLSSVDKYGRGDDDDASVSLDALTRQRFDLAVEDSLEMAAFLVERCATEVILLDRPWNRNTSIVSEQAAARIVRLAGWADIDAHVTGGARAGASAAVRNNGVPSGG